VKNRELVAWLLLGLVAVVLATHWRQAKAAWKYRVQLEQLGDVADSLEQIGVKK
jgi:hypothetical protein